MTADEALRIAKAAAASGNVRFFILSGHALERAPGRSASLADIYEAIRTSDVAVPSRKDNGNWELHGGCDTDECGLVPVVAIKVDPETRVTVVTVLYPNS